MADTNTDPKTKGQTEEKKEKCTMMGGKRLQRRILSRRKSKSHYSRKNKSHHGRKSKSRRKRQQLTKRNR